MLIHPLTYGLRQTILLHLFLQLAPLGHSIRQLIQLVIHLIPDDPELSGVKDQHINYIEVSCICSTQGILVIACSN